MDQLTSAQKAILETLDAEIEKLEEKLRKVQPHINELNRLKATRRTLLAERSTTSGGGGIRQQLSMEEVIRVLREADDGLTPKQLSEALSAPDGTVRSHLSRNQGTRYTKVGDLWYLTEEAPDEEE